MTRPACALPRSSAPRLLSFCFVVACCACNTTSPARDVSLEQVDAGAAMQAAAPTASAAPTPRAGSSAEARVCASDGDCRTFSSYCNEMPCACLVLGRSAPDPTCAGPSSVRCLVDPCGHKAAACQDGQCVLVSGSTH